ncbi:MAG: hypothetical protein PHT40_03505 [Patescibacteria group bacterium]|nr:hypothetical protein [Patescibacteria group bacterium]
MRKQPKPVEKTRTLVKWANKVPKLTMPKAFVDHRDPKGVERALATILRVVEGLDRMSTLFSTKSSALTVEIGMTKTALNTSRFARYLYYFHPEVEVEGFGIEEQTAGQGLGKPTVMATARALQAEANDEMRKMRESVSRQNAANLRKAGRLETLLLDMIRAAKAGQKADLVNILSAIGSEVDWNTAIDTKIMADVVDQLSLSLRAIVSMKSPQIASAKPMLRSWQSSLGSAKRSLYSRKRYGYKNFYVPGRRTHAKVSHRLDYTAVAEFLVAQAKEK